MLLMKCVNDVVHWSFGALLDMHLVFLDSNMVTLVVWAHIYLAILQFLQFLQVLIAAFREMIQNLVIAVEILKKN